MVRGVFIFAENLRLGSGMEKFAMKLRLLAILDINFLCLSLIQKYCVGMISPLKI